MVTRHGRTKRRSGESKDDPSLNGDSVRAMYHQANEALGEFVINEAIGAEDIFIDYSGLQRTLHTARARVAGAFGLRPIPRRQEDVLGVPVNTVGLDKILGFEDLKYEEYAYAADEKGYVAKWVANPNVNRLPGGNGDVTPFNQVVSSRASYLDYIIKRMTHGNSRFGVVATHSGVIEASAVAAVNSGRDEVGVERVDEIGGPFDRENFYLIYLDPRGSGNYEARYVRGKLECPMDFDNLRVIAGGSRR